MEGTKEKYRAEFHNDLKTKVEDFLQHRMSENRAEAETVGVGGNGEVGLGSRV